jgi:hypothetical protein
MAENQEVYVLDEASMVRLWLTVKVDSGAMTQPQATRFWNDYTRDGSRFLATYFTLAGDIALLTKLARDLGTPLGKVYFKSYGGKTHVIFKGHAGLRKILTGTRYGVVNAKVVSLGIGEKGVRQATRKGGILSIILITAWNIADFVLKDDVTLGQFIGRLSTDIAKIGASTVVGSLAGAAAVGTAVGAFALGPLVVAVAVGLGVSLALDYLDDKYGWTSKLQAFLDRKIAAINARLRQIRDDAKLFAIRSAAEVLDELVDVAAESARRRFLREIDKYFPFRRSWPSLPSLPDFPSLPDLPSLPSIPGLPSMPSLPSPGWPSLPRLPRLPRIG